MQNKLKQISIQRISKETIIQTKLGKESAKEFFLISIKEIANIEILTC